MYTDFLFQKRFTDLDYLDRFSIFERFCKPWHELQRACEANAVGENSSFVFTVCVKSVPLLHFKLTYANKVILADLEMSLIHSI